MVRACILAPHLCQRRKSQLRIGGDVEKTCECCQNTIRCEFGDKPLVLMQNGSWADPRVKAGRFDPYFSQAWHVG